MEIQKSGKRGGVKEHDPISEEEIAELHDQLDRECDTAISRDFEGTKSREQQRPTRTLKERAEGQGKTGQNC
jgi:hypothetical protein